MPRLRSKKQEHPRRGRERGLMLQPLPPLVCHWANITHHISVRICQFLPLWALSVSGYKDRDRPSLCLRGEAWLGSIYGVTAAAPVKNWEDFNTSSLLMMAGAGAVEPEPEWSNILIWLWRNNYILETSSSLPSLVRRTNLALIVSLFTASWPSAHPL